MRSCTDAHQASDKCKGSKLRLNFLLNFYRQSSGPFLLRWGGGVCHLRVPAVRAGKHEEQGKVSRAGVWELPTVLGPRSEGDQCEKKTRARDVVATVKWDLKVGEKLEGEGGFTVYGKLMPAADSVTIEGLPIVPAHGFVLGKDVKKDQGLSWEDVEYSDKSRAVAVGKEMEPLFRKEFEAKNANGSNRSNGVH